MTDGFRACPKHDDSGEAGAKRLLRAGLGDDEEIMVRPFVRGVALVRGGASQYQADHARIGL
jgi:hypothetical protein